MRDSLAVQDPETFQTEIEKARPMLLRLTTRMVGPDYAHDALQEAFLKAWKKVSQFKGECAFTTWLYSIAFNECAMMLRKQTTEDAFNRSVPLTPGDDEPAIPLVSKGPSQADILLANENSQRILYGLSKLPSRHQVVLHLTYFLDLSKTEIASALGMPVGTVSGRQTQARQALRAILERSQISNHDGVGQGQISSHQVSGAVSSIAACASQKSSTIRANGHNIAPALKNLPSENPDLPEVTPKKSVGISFKNL